MSLPYAGKPIAKVTNRPALDAIKLTFSDHTSATLMKGEGGYYDILGSRVEIVTTKAGAFAREVEH